MRVVICVIFVSICCIQSGCSSRITSSDNTNISDSNESSSVHLMRPTIENASTQIQTNQIKYKDKDIGNVEKENEEFCRIKYHELFETNHYMVVEGKIGLQGNRYPIVLDTGASQPIFLSIAHVSENKLPVFPVTYNNTGLNGYILGLCYLSSLEIGDILFDNRQCFYLKPRKAINLSGIPIQDSLDDNIVILGLPILQEFNYVIFDNILTEAEFSYDKSFNPDEPADWDKYPISIEEDFHNNFFLFIEICIAGVQTKLQVDTGSGRGLAVSETLWENISSNIPNVELKKGKDYYPYIGRLDCKKSVITTLRFGDRNLRNAEVSVFPDDSPLVSESEGMVGMEYFEDTILTLDFERSLMWVRNLE